MNSPEKNNYVQYVNELGKIQTKPVLFLNDGVNTTFVVQGIQENFFILGVYENNIQRYGIGFDDIENNDMLAFINSNIIDLDCIPPNAFLNSEQVVTMSYNNDYVKQEKTGSSPQSSGSVQKTNERLFFEEYCKQICEGVVIVPFSRNLEDGQGVYPIDYERNVLFYARATRFANYFTMDYQKTGISLAPQIPVTDNNHVFTVLYNPSGQHVQNCEVIGYKAIFPMDLWIEPR